MLAGKGIFMSNRLFQNVIHQMKTAVDRVIGVIDENGIIEAVMPKVKPDTNAAEILEML